MTELEILQSFIGKEFEASPSPFMRWLKPVILAVDKGSVCFQYFVRHEWTNPMGTLHGGMTAAIFDDIVGATMYSLGEEYFFTTLNNVIDYFSPAKEGDTIIAETKIIKKGTTVINAQCEIWNADRTRMIARGYTNLLKTNTKR